MLKKIELLRIFDNALQSVLKSITQNTFTLISSFVIDDELPVKKNMYNMKLNGIETNDLFLSFDDEVKNIIIKEIIWVMKIKAFSMEVDEEEIIKEFLNIFSVRLSGYFKTNNINLAVNLPEKYISSKKVIGFQKSLVLVYSSPIGKIYLEMAIHKYENISNLNFLVIGFYEEIKKDMIYDWITQGIEMMAAINIKEANEYVKLKKVNLCIIDFLTIESKPHESIKLLTETSKKYLNILISISRNKVKKLTEFPIFGENYNIIGAFLKGNTYEESKKYIFNVIKKTGILHNDRRSNIRINTDDKKNFSLTFNHMDIDYTGKILNLSLGGFLCRITQSKQIYSLQVGEKFTNIKIHLGIQIINADIILLYWENGLGSFRFDNLHSREKHILASIIFNHLSDKSLFTAEKTN